jgi:hypothetical protein
MKDINRWILLVVIMIASLAIAIDHITHQRPVAGSLGGQLPDDMVDAAGYGIASDDGSDDELDDELDDESDDESDED